MVRARAKLDLTGLEMAVERRESEGGRRARHDPHGPVPGTWHADDVFIAYRKSACLSLQPLKAGELRWRDRVEVGGNAADELVRRHACGGDSRSVEAMKQRSNAVLRTLQPLGIDASRQRRRAVLQR